MAMHPSTFNPKTESVLKIVGGNRFGRNPKISPEQTFNMFISDNYLVDTSGYKKKIAFGSKTNGRGNFTSFRGDFTIAVRGNSVYRITGTNDNLLEQRIFNLDTFFGKVSIDENIGFQIAICDSKSLWIYDYRANIAQKAVLPINTQTGAEIIPGYVTYHDGYFIVTDLSSSNWYLSPLNDGLANWNWGAGGVPVYGTLQQKADSAQAAVRAAGKGNLIYVLGKVSGNMFYNNGAQSFPYQLTNSISIDYGCVSVTTIASMDEYIAFLGANEKSGPCILISQGGPFIRLSTDGIDYKLQRLVNPEMSTAFFYRMDGHVFYQITFYDPRDNYSLIYDFNTKEFSYVTDENMNYHIAADIASFNNTYYFVSLNDGDLYEMNSDYHTYDYTNPELGSRVNDFEIPCVRICNRIAPPDASETINNSLTFTLEQGIDTNYPSSTERYISTNRGKILTQEAPPGYVGKFISTERVLEPYRPRIDMTISKDGGYTFGNASRKLLNPLGDRKNRVVFWGLGLSNELCVQLRFWSKARKTVSDGIIQIRLREAM